MYLYFVCILARGEFLFCAVHFSFCKDMYSLVLFPAYLTHCCVWLSTPAATCKSSLYLLAAEHSLWAGHPPGVDIQPASNSIPPQTRLNKYLNTCCLLALCGDFSGMCTPAGNCWPVGDVSLSGMEECPAAAPSSFTQCVEAPCAHIPCEPAF